MQKTIIALILCLALGMGLTAAPPAQASIVYVNIPDQVISPGGSGYDLDVNQDGTPEFNLNVETVSYTLNNPFGTNIFLNGSAADMTNATTNNNFVVGTYYNQYIYTVPFFNFEISADIPLISYLSEDTPINSGSSFLDDGNVLQLPQTFGQDFGGFELIASLSGLISGNIGPYNPGFNNQKGYAGFQFLDTDGIHYGWVEIEVGYSSIDSLTIYRYAYETEPGIGIEAGAVPLPASVLLLGSGLMGLGLLGWRRKKS